LQPDFLPDGGEGGHFLGGPAALVFELFPGGKHFRAGFVAYPLPPDSGSLIQAMQMDQGYLMFIALQGYYWSRLQVTYTGGFWFDTTEDGSGVMPATATPLPAAVKSAWYLQCQHVWKRWDKLGAQIAQNPEGQSALSGLAMVPMAEEFLRPFKRMQMS
jgi:hypothetical protein